MSRFASFFIVVLFSAGSAAANTKGVPAPVATQPTGSEIHLYPSITDLLLAETNKHVNVNTTPDDSNYMMTVAFNTLGGALVGLLIGGAIYLLQDPDNRRPVNLAWWTGGGALVGVGAGVVQVIVSERRDSAAVSRREIMTDDARQVLGWTHNF